MVKRAVEKIYGVLTILVRRVICPIKKTQPLEEAYYVLELNIPFLESYGIFGILHLHEFIDTD